jgi:acyl-CoA reductase-like NAD-dependent aldehyde dehydrogenase
MAAALAAGCTVVIKASEMCPWTHTFLVETLIEAGFPAGTVNLIMADRSAAAEVTEAVISHPALRFVEFIGSEAVGRAVGVIAAKHLKPIMMETGDQSPAIILDDANLPQAADLCAKGALMLHGQLCFSTERIIVQSSVKDEFCRLLVGAFEANKHLTGSAVSRAFADKSKRLVDDALDRGAKLLYGDNKLTNPSSLGPTILIDVAPDSLISKGEAFAPTVLITTVETDPQAIVEANSRHGGLLASVFTKNQERGLNMAKELEFGQVNVNHMTLYVECKCTLSTRPPIRSSTNDEA